MIKKSASSLALVILLAALPATLQAQDARTVLTNVSKAMGADNLKTLRYTGSGSSYALAQTPSGAQPRSYVKTYTREIDLNVPAARTQVVRVPEGATAEQTQNQVIGANSSWTTQSEIWLTPFGFLKGAMSSNPTLTTEKIDGATYKVITFMKGQNQVKGFINDANMVERIQTLVDTMITETIFHGYKDFGGLQFPDTIIEKQSGFLIMALIVNDVKPNAPVTIPPAE